MIQRIAKSTPLLHPKTGQPLQPVFTSKTGRVYWPILGAAENDDDDKSKDDNASGEGSDKDKGGDDKDKDDTDKGDDKSSGSDKDDDKKVSQSDLDAVTERMKAADRRAAAAEAKVKEFEDKDKDELTKATEKAAEDEKKIEALTKENESLRLANAFALNNSYTWHDPSVVLDLVRKRDDVTLEEDGTVKGMDAALKAIAKDKPFLVKDKDSDDKDKDETPPRTGSRAGLGVGKDGKPDEKAVRKRFRI